MAKVKTSYVCHGCGYQTVKFFGRCPGCGEWGTLLEEAIEEPTPGGRGWLRPAHRSDPVPITEVPAACEERWPTGFGELDRVLGGGLVPGSLVLIGGDPGIGKSTLLLQASAQIAQARGPVLYVSGEESSRQIHLRARRLKAMEPSLLVLPETDLSAVERAVERIDPRCLVIDSIQTVHDPDVSSAPGSVAQVRECTGRLLRLAKERELATLIVGHVTKEGAIAGPRLLEHMVDAVVYFEGARHHTYRILRAVKNRFGSTNEIGIFEMRDGGLREVHNPSELFLPDRQIASTGSAVVAGLEGTRPILVEIQALVADSGYAVPRRTASGIDVQRVALMLAVLEKRCGLYLRNQDTYVNVAGGVRLDEPAVDLGLAVSLASSFRDRPVSPRDVYIGEVGLTGEIRTVSRMEQRLGEAVKLGFQRCIVPAGNARELHGPPGMEIIAVETVEAAFQAAFEG
ncbi:DNA repair protein RadA [Kyrpidia spormannii]|uniref:DNA repair protein 6-O-methylguanine-DNA methyltransferase n=2 Tax=Kyrpidia spormannii TaxID=2055160 RepID=A0ACA8Z4K0_9BACL|nr:DNA repair protein RadA [Kyrpidia spormannii]CAB3389305.1 DNA repair protein; 6-O-methylguanine-DNA methyltransferase [Kyrpidia spormannii]CAB3389872.1 DNA repair protein; 6-O-methylguanine-DNA methyltransferase [Kyrpidia spormannii]